MNKNRSKFFEILTPALIGIVGVCLGALITGYFQSKSQGLQVTKDIQLETTKGSRELTLKMVEASSSYFSELMLFPMLSEVYLKNGNMEEKQRELIKTAHDLAMLTSYPTSLKVLSAVGVAEKVLSSRNDQEKKNEAIEQFNKAYGEAYRAVYFDIAKYRWRGTPEAGSDELLYSAIQLMLGSNNKNEQHDKTN